MEKCNSFRKGKFILFKALELVTFEFMITNLLKLLHYIQARGSMLSIFYDIIIFFKLEKLVPLKIGSVKNLVFPMSI